MQLSVLSLVVVLVAASGPSAPAPRANWDLVAEKGRELQILFMSSIEAIRNTSTIDHPSVGQDIGYLLDIKIGEGIILGTGVRRSIDKRTLTQEEANAYVAELRGLIVNLETEMEPFLVQLTPTAQAQIAFTVTFWKAQDTLLAAELLAALAWEPEISTTEGPSDGTPHTTPYWTSTWWK